MINTKETNFLSVEIERLSKTIDDLNKLCAASQDYEHSKKVAQDRKSMFESILNKLIDKKEENPKWEDLIMQTCKQCGFPQGNEEYEKLKQKINESEQLLKKCWQDSRYYNIMSFEDWRKDPDNF